MAHSMNVGSARLLLFSVFVLLPVACFAEGAGSPFPGAQAQRLNAGQLRALRMALVELEARVGDCGRGINVGMFRTAGNWFVVFRADDSLGSNADRRCLLTESVTVQIDPDWNVVTSRTDDSGDADSP
jgi:hypothetical protein